MVGRSIGRRDFDALRTDHRNGLLVRRKDFEPFCNDRDLCWVYETEVRRKREKDERARELQAQHDRGELLADWLGFMPGPPRPCRSSRSLNFQHVLLVQLL